jgi:hypothetical protein
MKIETYLNAYDKSKDLEDHLSGMFAKPPKLESMYYRKVRQRKAFRARILRMNADKDVIISSMWRANFRLAKRIKELEGKDDD